MAFSFDNTILDAALTALKGTRTLHICSGNPTDRAQAITNSLANVALAAGDFSANANHATSGRQTVTAAKSGVAVTGTGEPLHYCIIDGTNLLAKTEVDQPDSPDLTSGSTVNIPTVTWSIAQPTAG